MAQRKFKKVSRWIKIEYQYVTPKHSLYDYAKGNDDCLVSFRYKGKRYALSEFINRHSLMSGLSDDYPEYIHGYQGTQYWNPLFIEISDNGEAVRLYEDITKEDELCIA